MCGGSAAGPGRRLGAVVAVVEVKDDAGGPFIGEMRRWSGGGRWGGRRAVRSGVNDARCRGAERRGQRGAHW